MEDDGDTEAQNPNTIDQKAPRSKLRKAVQSVEIYALLTCLLLTVIFLTIPSMKKATILGSLLWKWSVLVDVILLGYPFLLIIALFLSGMIDNLGIRGTFIEYGINGGLPTSIWLLLHLCAILVTWLFCVGTSLGSLHKYGTLTLVSFIIGAVFSVMKKLALLWWKTKYIFPKYKGKILAAWFHLYFFHKIHPRSRFTVGMINLGLKPMEFCDLEEVPEYEDKKVRAMERYMSERNVSTPKLEETLSCLRDEVQRTQKITPDFSDLHDKLLGDHYWGDYRKVAISKKPFEVILENNEESMILFKMLRLDMHKEDVTCGEFENWVSHGLSCYYWAVRRFSGAHDALRLLDRIITGLIVVLVILTWIFITGLATTNVVLALASLFVGLSFMFGDSCKTFFQGVIFSFITHPFDVGDRCVIDDKKLEVTKINILTTTFLESSTKKIVLYPNLNLATKQITIVQGEPMGLELELEKEQIDLDDVVEYYMPSSITAAQIISLQHRIEGFLINGLNSGQFSKDYAVTVDQIGGKIIMAVRFKYIADRYLEDERLKSLKLRRYQTRSSVLLATKQFLENILADQG